MTRNRIVLHRRAVLVGLAGAAASGLLAACGENAATTPPATTAVPTPGAAATSMSTPAAMTTTVRPATAATAQMTAGRKIAIEYWHSDNNGARGPIVKRLVARFNENVPSITVADRAFPDFNALQQAVQAALAARMPPAVAQVGFSFLHYVAGEIPHTTIDEIAKRDPQGADFLGARNFAPNILDLGRVDGVLHGMPYSLSNPVFWYNADLFRQLGLERPPTTWPEVRTQARQVVERTGKQGLYIAEPTNFFTYQGLVESNGARLLIGTGRDARCGIDSPEAIEAMQFMQDMVREKSALSVPVAQGQQSFLSGDVAFYVQSSTAFQNISMSAKFAAGATLYPTWGTKPRRIPAGGDALFVFSPSVEQQNVAWEWIKFLTAPETMTTWVKETGLLPTRLGLADDPRYLKVHAEENALVKPSFEQLPGVVPWVSYPGKSGVEADKELLDARGKILNGQDVAATLRDVTTRINQLIRG